MDRLSLMLTPVTGAVITGSLAAIVLALGFYSWIAIGIVAFIGCILAWPAAFLVSRRIKDNDPFWTTRHPEVQLRAHPGAGLPEV